MIDRRSLMAGAALFAGAGSALAQEKYPSYPIKVIVPFGPGGLADVTIRAVAEKAGPLIGQPLVVVNQPGAGGITAAKAVQAAHADGYTLALFTNGTAISVPLVKALGFDPVSEFAPISSLGFFDFLIVTSAEHGYRTLGDLIAAAKTKGLNAGTINIGSTQNLTAELIKSETGGRITIVPFRNSGDAVAALIRKDVDFVVEGYVAVRAMMADKRLVPLAVTGARRAAYLPDVPTAAEAGLPGFDVTSWNALFARAGTPPAVVEAVNRAVGAALADEGVRKRLLDLGIEARGGTPQDIGDRLKADIAKWGEVIRKAGVERQ